MHGMEYVLAVRAGRASAIRTWAAAWPDLHLLGVVLSDSLDKDGMWHVMQGLFSPCHIEAVFVHLTKF